MRTRSFHHRGTEAQRHRAQRHRAIAPSQAQKRKDAKDSRRHRKGNTADSADRRRLTHRTIATSQMSQPRRHQDTKASQFHRNIAVLDTDCTDDTDFSGRAPSGDAASSGRGATTRPSSPKGYAVPGSRGIEARWTDHHVQARVDRIHLRLGSCLRHAHPASGTLRTPTASPTCHLERVSPRTSRKVPRSAEPRLSLRVANRSGGTSFAPSLNAQPKLRQPCFLRGILRLRGLGGRSAQDDMWERASEADALKMTRCGAPPIKQAGSLLSPFQKRESAGPASPRWSRRALGATGRGGGWPGRTPAFGATARTTGGDGRRPPPTPPPGSPAMVR